MTEPRQSQSEDISGLMLALAKAQGAYKPLPTNRSVDKGKQGKQRYATLDAVIKAIAEALSENEIAHSADYNDGILTVSLHWHNQWKASRMPVPFSGNWQDFGSSRTYCWRYLLAPLAGISADFDDDANKADRTGHEATDPMDELCDILLGHGVHEGAEMRAWIETALKRPVPNADAITNAEITTMIEFAKSSAAWHAPAKPSPSPLPPVASAKRLNLALEKLRPWPSAADAITDAKEAAEAKKLAKLKWANGILLLATPVTGFIQLTEDQIATLITAAENGEMPTNPNDDDDTFPTDME